MQRVVGVLLGALCAPVFAQHVEVVVEAAPDAAPLTGVRVVLERQLGAVRIPEQVGQLVDGRCRLAVTAAPGRRWARIDAESPRMTLHEGEPRRVVTLARVEAIPGQVALVRTNPELLAFARVDAALREAGLLTGPDGDAVDESTSPEADDAPRAPPSRPKRKSKGTWVFVKSGV